MGCDIHVNYEVFKDSKWVNLNWEDEFYEKPGRGGLMDYEAYSDSPLHLYRNYHLFAILADVRNGIGFAGIKTGSGFNPISSPKGLPKDASAESRRDSADYGEDGHSHSWLTVKEILDFDWNGQVSTLTGWVELGDYIEFKEKGRPGGHCGGVTGGCVQHISNEQMDEFENDPSVMDPTKNYYTQISWDRTYTEAAGTSLFKAMNFLTKHNKPEHVRLIFFFDN